METIDFHLIAPQILLLVLAVSILIKGKIKVSKRLAVVRPYSTFLGILILLFLVVPFFLMPNIRDTVIFFISFMASMSLFVFVAKPETSELEPKPITVSEQKKIRSFIVLLALTVLFGLIILWAFRVESEGTSLLSNFFYFWPIVIPWIVGLILLSQAIVNKE